MKKLNLIGQRLGNRYEILEKLGGGGMALVYKAKDSLLNRVVTVKVLRDEYADDQDFVRRFRQEAQAVASLSHLNIVNIFDVGYFEGNHYLIMEFIEGQNLKEIIKERAPFSIDETLNIANQICEGLEHAHENKIIHRDIKPHNILITRNGKVKVTDFGLARAVTTATLIHSKKVLGSVHYFSPEQAKGELADEKSDIYSLGVVLYEMLTGQLPFTGGDSPISVALKHIEDEPESLRKLNPAVSKGLEYIVKKAMAKDSHKRYSSIGELKKDLLAIKNKTYQMVDSEDEDFDKTKEVEPVKSLGSNKRDKKQKRKVKPLIAIIGAIMALALIVTGIFFIRNLLVVPEVEVPGVVGLTLFEGDQILRQRGLNLEIGVERHDPEIPKDRILSQTPEPGAIVKQTRSIVVDVSKGPILVPVPEVVGQARLQAEIALQNEGFLVEVELEYSNLVAQGNVIRQLPRANSMEPEGETVVITVSRGAEPSFISIPDLTGMTLEEARNTLRENRLALGLVSSESSRQFFEGRVIRQDVPPQSLILQGQTVNLVISSGPGPAAQRYKVDVPVPQDKEEGIVKIIVSDARGTRTVYELNHRGGELVTRHVELFGQGTISIYIDNELIKEQQLP